MKLSYDVIHPPGDKQRNLPPIVMLHGMVDSRKTWKRIAPNLSKNTGRIVYVIDERNHGTSPRTESMNWVDLAEDIGDFLNQHNIPKAILVGHSMGGRAAFTFALMKPEMVEKLIVEDISARTIRLRDGLIILNIITFLKESLKAIPEGASELTAKKVTAEFMKAILSDTPSSSNDFFDPDFIPLGKEGDRFVWQANLDAVEDFLTTEKLAHDVSKLGIYNGDAMWLYGTKSLFKVNKDDLIEKLFPRAVKVAFESDHLIHHECPARFEKVTTDFINKGLTPKI